MSRLKSLLKEKRQTKSALKNNQAEHITSQNSQNVFPRRRFRSESENHAVKNSFSLVDWKIQNQQLSKIHRIFSAAIYLRLLNARQTTRLYISNNRKWFGGTKMLRTLINC
jgi:hypothetical protein